MRGGSGKGSVAAALRRTVVLSVALGLAAAMLAGTGLASVSVTAGISGTGTSYRLTVTNTGTEAIKCFGLLLDGVQPTSATGPSGVLTRVGVFQGRGLVHMQGDVVVAPGGTATVDFRTNVPIPAGAGGEIRYSSTCAAGSDVLGRATGPAPPPPAPADCHCTNLTVEGSNYSSAQVGNGATTLKLTLRWRLSCSAGDGDCAGRLRFKQLGAADLRVVTPKSATVTCRGKCDPAGPTSAAGRIAIRVTSKNRLDFDNRRGKTVVFAIQRSCLRNGKDVSVRATSLRLVFAGSGFLDKKKSDLNGNGKPDGSEKA